MKASKIICFFTILFCGLSCNSKPKQIYIDTDTTESEYVEEEDTDDLGGTVKVPFKVVGGVKMINVTVNGLGVEMIFDTGCSDALISVAEANYLYQKGKLTRDDILGSEAATIADGSVVENMVVNLKEVVVGEKIVCNDVKAIVSKNVNAPLLLGNAVLDRVASYKIDNENETINFDLK